MSGLFVQPAAPKLRPLGLFLQTGTVTIMQGDALEQLKRLPPNYFQTCITSPPYYKMRDYGNDRQIGMETTPGEYIAKLVQIFEEVRRVLRDDGVVWLNLGDSYASGGMGPGSNNSKQSTNRGANIARKNTTPGFKPKDLLMIPSRVAIALQESGWYLRRDIIWNKPNPLPESVTDRPTGAHEFVFLLAKERNYYYDADAVKEQSTYRERFVGNYSVGGGARDGRADFDNTTTTRNLRDVWTFTSEQSDEEHFAIMPQKMAEICVKAGSSEKGCCPKCWAPWELKRTTIAKELVGNSRGSAATIIPDRIDLSTSQMERNVYSYDDWSPTCACPLNDPVPCAVLDPFGGVGTTGLVAAKLGRHTTVIELNADYIEIMKKRIKSEGIAYSDSDTKPVRRISIRT